MLNFDTLLDVINSINLLESTNKNSKRSVIEKVINDLVNEYNEQNEDNTFNIIRINKNKTNKKFIDNLGKINKVDNENEYKYKCVICLLKLKQNDIILQLKKCEHYFHKDCIKEWMDINDDKFCPLCMNSNKDIYNNCITQNIN